MRGSDECGTTRKSHGCSDISNSWARSRVNTRAQTTLSILEIEPWATGVVATIGVTIGDPLALDVAKRGLALQREGCGDLAIGVVEAASHVSRSPMTHSTISTVEPSQFS